MSEEPFSIEVGDIIRHKEGWGKPCEVLEKWRSGTTWYYRLRHTDGSMITQPAASSRNGLYRSERQMTAVYTECERWAMKLVRGPGEEQAG